MVPSCGFPGIRLGCWSYHAAATPVTASGRLQVLRRQLFSRPVYLWEPRRCLEREGCGGMALMMHATVRGLPRSRLSSRAGAGGALGNRRNEISLARSGWEESPLLPGVVVVVVPPCSTVWSILQCIRTIWTVRRSEFDGPDPM